MTAPKPTSRKKDAETHVLGAFFKLGGGCSMRTDALDFNFVRGSGPGGQHVNKTSTKAQLRVLLREIMGLDDAGFARLRVIASSHVVGVDADEALLISDQTSRSQADNRDACLTRLKTLVSMAAKRPKVRRKTKPTRGSVERRIDAKKRDGEIKRTRRSQSE
jgi:ribosome-associated protein